MGFPDRPPRLGFGPEMRNKRPPINLETDLTADQMNLDFWQMAGAGRVLPMTVILFDGVTPAVLFQAAAYDPNQELPPIAVVKNGTGDYTFTFESTYKNERGQPKSFVPTMAMSMAQGGTVGDIANTVFPSGQDVTVRYRNAAAALTDGTFVLAVW